MAFLAVKAKYSKSKGLRLLECLKLDKRSDPRSDGISEEYEYFYPADQFLCKHIRKLQNPINFKKYHQVYLKFDSSEFPAYFDFSEKRLKFGTSNLLSECDYRAHCEANRSAIVKLFEDHRDCSICCGSFQPIRQIRKRKRLDNQTTCSCFRDTADGEQKTTDRHQAVPLALRAQWR